MLRFRSLRPALAAGLLVAAVACNDTSTPSGPDGSLLASRGQGGSSAELPSAAELDRQVPGFGGFFLDRDGNPTIYLTRGADRESPSAHWPGISALAGWAPQPSMSSRQSTAGSSSNAGRPRRPWPHSKHPVPFSSTMTRPAIGSRSVWRI